VLEPVLEV